MDAGETYQVWSMIIGTVGIYGPQDADCLIRAIQAALRQSCHDRANLIKRMHELRRMKFRAFNEEWHGWYAN